MIEVGSVVHLERLPISETFVQGGLDGWIVRAIKETGVADVNQQSSTAVSHYTGMIQWPNAIWISRREVKQGIIPSWYDQDSRFKFYLRRMKAARWVSSTCIKWLLFQLVSGQYPFKKLTPMVTSRDIGHLRKVFEKNYTCPLRQAMMKPADESARILQVRTYSSALNRILQNYQRLHAQYDFRKYPEEDQAEAQKAQQEVNDALVSILAWRFLNRKQISNKTFQLDKGTLAAMFKVVNQIIFDRARRELIRSGINFPTVSQIRALAAKMRIKAYEQMAVPVDYYRREHIIEGIDIAESLMLRELWRATW
jgi:hypothetical protein